MHFTYTINKRRLKGSKKNVDQPGTSEPKKPSAFFCFIYSSPGSGEANNLEKATGPDKKEPQEKHALSSQRTRKAAAQQDRKLLDKTTLL